MLFSVSALLSTRAKMGLMAMMIRRRNMTTMMTPVHDDDNDDDEKQSSQNGAPQQLIQISFMHKVNTGLLS